jgi:hypothetical protein
VSSANNHNIRRDFLSGGDFIYLNHEELHLATFAGCGFLIACPERTA